MLMLRGEHKTYTCRTLKISVLFMECEMFRDRQRETERERARGVQERERGGGEMAERERESYL